MAAGFCTNVFEYLHGDSDGDCASFSHTTFAISVYFPQTDSTKDLTESEWAVAASRASGAFTGQISTPSYD